jgi:hypothetical protein
MLRRISTFLVIFFLLCTSIVSAQTDTLIQEAEEDFSMYENLNFADEGAKRFCTPKVFDLSPAKLISIGHEYQGGFDIDYGDWSNSDEGSSTMPSRFSGANGSRISANIPVISKTNVVLQVGFNYAKTHFNSASTGINPLNQTLKTNGLTTSGLNTTLFKPFSEDKFMIFQASGDLNGDYTFNDLLQPKYTRFSSALIFGKKTNDRKMIGFGISRTYRVGELNYIPVILLNWTAPSRTWGIEMLAPARLNVRKNFSPRNILMFGYELEGNSYRILANNEIAGTGIDTRNIELRRSELKIRATWETSLQEFVWMSLQFGYRYGYSFNLDQFSNDKEFFRGFFGDQTYFQENKLGGTWYLQWSINLVSP